MPQLPAFEPAGFSIRANTVFEPVGASVPSDERQARRVVAQADDVWNAVSQTPHRPRVGHVRRTPVPTNSRTGNLFLNTSLEEPVLPLAPPSPMPDIRHVQAQMEAQEQRRFAVLREQDMARQRALEQKRAAHADKIADVLRAVRGREQSLLALFQLALSQWKQQKPSELADFLVHFRNASVAASSNARVWDIASWYPTLPETVARALKAVQHHYHQEAGAVVQLKRVEERSGGWSTTDDLDEEMLITAERDNTRRQQAGRGKISIFGLDVMFDDIGVYSHRESPPGQEKARLLVIMVANLEVRKTLFQASFGAAKLKPRYQAKSIKFRDTIDYSITQWCCGAIDAIESPSKPSADDSRESAALQKLSDRILLQITTFADTIDAIFLRSTITTLKAQLCRVLARAEAMSTKISANDPQAFEGYTSMCVEAVKLRTTMRQFEKEHGKDVLGVHWTARVNKAFAHILDQSIV